jgi:hypothetical protein
MRHSISGLTKAVRGVNSDGFITIVHPTASAGATFQALCVWQAISSDELGDIHCFYPPHVDRVVPWDTDVCVRLVE